MAKERLQKILSREGIASRRKAEELMLQGRVTLDGRVRRDLGARADMSTQEIRVDGVKVRRGPVRCLILYKPKGYICTKTDPKGRRTVYSLLEKYPSSLFSVGRLDFDTEGLLLFTNDGGLASTLTHPSKGVEKTYMVKVNGVPDAKAINKLRTGVPVDGRKTAPAKVSIVKKTDKNAWLRIVIHEGRYRQIKKMCLHVGHPVIKLKRTGFAGLRLGDLKPGCYRELTDVEIDKLRGYF